MKKVLGIIAIVIGVAIAILATILASAYSPAAPAYTISEPRADFRRPMRNSEQHDEVRKQIGDAPYVLEFSKGKGHVVFYGSHHTSNPNDPQMSDIEMRFAKFDPTVALYEGRQRSFFDTDLLDRVKGKTEAEKLHQLADAKGIPIYTLEPEYEVEVQELLSTFPPDLVAMYFFTRVYWSEAGGEADEELALDLLKKRTDVEGLRGALQSLDGVDRLWRRRFASHGDWRTRTEEPDDPFFVQIANRSREIRGHHMARTLIALASEGNRVFAVVGSGHVIRLEWILRDAFDGSGATPLD